ncbi:SH3 domain-containing protein C23A1.17-like [Monodon monoceros]|uniref:SH3 domain-containing protein C23A1.17-like n=1 Tax=Monodon monoceros TaxID=40151 RepID=UPI0010F4DF4F|nr:SH3 domain-containing protein C23A1.17-like [Monodon monoceros]
MPRGSREPGVRPPPIPRDGSGALWLSTRPPVFWNSKRTALVMPVTSGPPALPPSLPPEPDFSGLCPPGLSGASCCPVATVALPEQRQPPPLSLSPSALPAPQPQHGALLSALVSAVPLPESPAPHFLHAFTRESVSAPHSSQPEKAGVTENARTRELP